MHLAAAKFLEQFSGDVPWAHLDIAGPSWADSEGATRDAGGTGCFVRTRHVVGSHAEARQIRRFRGETGTARGPQLGGEHGEGVEATARGRKRRD